MFADTISSIVSDANEENIETWKERDAFMNSAMRRIMAKELQESRDEGINLIKKQQKLLKKIIYQMLLILRLLALTKIQLKAPYPFCQN